MSSAGSSADEKYALPDQTRNGWCVACRKLPDREPMSTEYTGAGSPRLNHVTAEAHESCVEWRRWHGSAASPPTRLVTTVAPEGPEI
ncbi:hypothetical protein IscW_ISCW011429 [Ixodes scapularis]|uniref:Uncharacterized protein n=1 Tax=Ixodes scapularis TaxID=6945 RepID=B7Q5Y3_IXOSC|nr:hypothetical protein IscW_ISCW011429 [Ixodes scapularis]|eukprot:XP_002411838.1 hypothetical protein IscW_ISCW011429 [Ixodes scapularis]